MLLGMRRVVQGPGRLFTLYRPTIDTCHPWKLRYQLQNVSLAFDWDNTSYLCLQTMKKRAFESVSHDFSSFKNVVVSLTNLCQGQLKISRENTKLPRKPGNRKRKYSPKDTPWRHAVRALAPIHFLRRCKQTVRKPLWSFC